MAKDPAFLFYTGDFSTGTQFFSDEQVGKYLRLMMAQHQHGHLTEQQMLHICKTHDEDIFSKFKKDDAGKYFQPRLESEILKRKTYSESRSKNRLSTPKTKRKNTSKSYVKHMENEIEIKNENTNTDKTELETAFDNWLLMRRKMKGGITDHAIELGKAELKKLSGGDSDLAIQIINQSILNSWKGFFPLKQEHGKQIRKCQPDTEDAVNWARGIISRQNND